MSMPLYEEIELSDLKEDRQRFEWLPEQLIPLIIKISEVHPSEGNDSTYIFLVWFDTDKTYEAGVPDHKWQTWIDGWRCVRWSECEADSGLWIVHCSL